MATISTLANPRLEHGFRCWRDARRDVRVCFVGRGPELDPDRVVRRLVPARVEPAWARQVHSADVLDAVPGCAGPGDALVTRRRGLALTVVTADCVPVLLASPEYEIAAVHAGWRGVAGRVVRSALERFTGPAAEITAWIGPAIGPCCYEVGEEVAAEVCDAVPAGVGILRPGPRGRPHLDLSAAVTSELRAFGVEEIRRVDRCTRCASEELRSYRREGASAGRNVACIWRSNTRTSIPPHRFEDVLEQDRAEGSATGAQSPVLASQR